MGFCCPAGLISQTQVQAACGRVSSSGADRLGRPWIGPGVLVLGSRVLWKGYEEWQQGFEAAFDYPR